MDPEYLLGLLCCHYSVDSDQQLPVDVVQVVTVMVTGSEVNELALGEVVECIDGGKFPGTQRVVGYSCQEGLEEREGGKEKEGGREERAGERERGGREGGVEEGGMEGERNGRRGEGEMEKGIGKEGGRGRGREVRVDGDK